MANSDLANIYYPGIGIKPNLPADLELMADSIEPVSVLQFASTSLRDSTVLSPLNGQVAACHDTGLWQYDGTTWWLMQRALPSCDTSSPMSTSPLNLIASGTTSANWISLGLAQTDDVRGVGISKVSSFQVGVARAGRYRLTGQVVWSTITASTGRLLMGFVLNGSSSGGLPPLTSGVPAVPGDVPREFSIPVNLSAGDKVALAVFQNTGATQTVTFRRLLVEQLY